MSEGTSKKQHSLLRRDGIRRRLGFFALIAAALVANESAMAGVSMVYWTDRDNGVLSATDLRSGTTQVLAQNFTRLQDVDLDTSTGILYFADWGSFTGNSGSINRVNSDGTGLVNLTDGVCCNFFPSWSP